MGLLARGALTGMESRRRCRSRISRRAALARRRHGGRRRRADHRDPRLGGMAAELVHRNSSLRSPRQPPTGCRCHETQFVAPSRRFPNIRYSDAVFPRAGCGSFSARAAASSRGNHRVFAHLARWILGDGCQRTADAPAVGQKQARHSRLGRSCSGRAGAQTLAGPETPAMRREGVAQVRPDCLGVVRRRSSS